MLFTPTPIAGAWLIEIEVREDARGFFARAWCEQELSAQGLLGRFVQCNNAFSRRAGTLRGLHYQTAPHAEVKLMRCIRGAVYDVIVDLRPESPTYLRWHGLELTAENRRALYIPSCCAHGYQTLTDDSEVLYPVSAPYAPAAERGVRWNDPVFGIHWPDAPVRHVSDKDQRWPDYVPEPRR